jgi:hypothetical protein
VKRLTRRGLPALGIAFSYGNDKIIIRLYMVNIGSGGYYEAKK